jgi:cytochrome P450 family 150 subfamily A5
MKDIASMDFFRDDTLVNDPYPYLEALRNMCPVRREPHHNVMMVTGYDEAMAVLGDFATFSSCISPTGPFPGFPVPLEGDDVSDLIEKHRDEIPVSDQIITFDPPKHTAHRALLMGLITPKRLKENEAFMWVLADRVLDEFLVDGRGEFINGVAGPFTLLVIADLLGVPQEDRDDFAAALGNRSDPGVGSTAAEAPHHAAIEYLYTKFSRYVEDRRRQPRDQPRDDVLTGMATATFPDGSMPQVIDVVRVAANVYSAGQETTVRLLGAAVKALAEQPDLQQLLRRERDHIPNFIEEMLRIESPVKGDFRLSRVPTSVGGVNIPAGSTVMVLNGAANRDPRQFDKPDTLDPARPNARRHIAFGRGIHSCPGAPLARAEARVCLERLFDRTTDIRIAEDKHGPADTRHYRYVPTFIMRGLAELYIEFTLADDQKRVST